MAHHDDNFKDGSGILPIILGIVVLVGMSALPATMGWIQAFGSESLAHGQPARKFSVAIWRLRRQDKDSSLLID